MSKTSIMKAGSVRGYLVLLHVMFGILYGFHLTPPLTGLEVGTLLLLCTSALLVLTIPGTQLAAPWFLSLLTMVDAGVLFGTMPGGPAGVQSIAGMFVLLAMVSYIPSVPHFAAVSGIFVTGYGVSLYEADFLHTEMVLLLPTYLCVTLVFLTKMELFQIQFQHFTEEKSRQTSMKDPLTGVANRAHLLQQLERIIQYRQHNYNFHFAVLFLDLDGFKPINDKLGHKAGDAVLCQTAKLLQGCVRKGDIVGRYGGDEFVILLNNVSSAPDVGRVADLILSKIRTPIQVGEPVVVGASIGISMSTNLHGGVEDFIRDADGAMYRAKAQGKNCYVLSDEHADVPKGELKERWKRMAIRSIVGGY